MSPRRTARKGEPPAEEALSFEDAFAQLNAVLAQLESGDLPLEASITAFERGMRLAHHCDALLNRAELRVQALEPQSDGTLDRRDLLIETE